MTTQHFIAGSIPERFVEVDAARLLLLLSRFAEPIDEQIRSMSCFPKHDVHRHFTPEYRLHKLDFLIRYPGYLVYELTELHRIGIEAARDSHEVIEIIRTVLQQREPELLTLPFRKFWRGAYERLDEVEAWWYARKLIYPTLELRGGARPQKHYFLSPLAEIEAQKLADTVEHARWYAKRIDVIHRFFGNLSAAQLKELQYSHGPYREAQLDEVIPDLPPDEIEENFARVFGSPLEVEIA